LKAGVKLAVVLSVCLGAIGCVDMPPEQSCAAICSELQECQISIKGSSLRPGPSCESDCKSRIAAHGGGCRSGASYLADCFQTYTCDGDNVGCSQNAQTFVEDCE
jgi:hypothetical protein